MRDERQDGDRPDYSKGGVSDLVREVSGWSEEMMREERTSPECFEGD